MSSRLGPAETVASHLATAGLATNSVLSFVISHNSEPKLLAGAPPHGLELLAKLLQASNYGELTFRWGTACAIGALANIVLSASRASD